ncbi:hypothetical protein SAMN06297129_0731 [Pseudooceanicola antarcticus]|uniref:Uncharacterized protein n=1 Tax=Pseudooceanicola antarcticus TaxID=1247613 RepID=A0A285HXT3_9RHOB|nr:hypothetical protein [Pseudooceanicola antarcticus]PJE30400.1 hypothetical protein CVM39_06755 [Pseudooceanicola antarcticus]SNY40453.1 hypothetical protein SAMN06297129_0731 [Pseudooceanicola antarcticus]
MTRFFQISRKAIISTIAGAVALTSVAATPARAGNDELARALIGIGALAIIGTAIANESKANNNNHHHNGGWQPKPQPRPRPAKTVPQFCEVRTWVNGYRAVGYAAACTKNNASRPQALPENCRQRTDVPRGQRGVKFIYRKACMKRKGWTTA